MWCTFYYGLITSCVSIRGFLLSSDRGATIMILYSLSLVLQQLQWPISAWERFISLIMTTKCRAQSTTSFIQNEFTNPGWALLKLRSLTHWGRVTHICVSKLIIIGSDNGLSPGRRQAIIWNNDGILLIRTLGTNFSEILSEIHSFSFKKMHFKMSSAKWRLFCLGLNELNTHEETFLMMQSTHLILWITSILDRCQCS